MIRQLITALPMLLAMSVARADSTNLIEMLAAVQRNSKVSQELMPLDRDWIGDIKDEEGTVTKLRLEKGRIVAGEISLLRTYPSGSYLGSDAPVYLKMIPANQELHKCATLGELKKLLGTGQPSISGWGGFGRLHSSHSWVCFSPVADQSLAYVSVFAHTSWTEDQRARDIVQIDRIQIQRGELRPANAHNDEERGLYLSGVDMFAAEERAKADSRRRYPEPLRGLIKIDEHPDDSNLAHLATAIQAIRDNPDPKLFHQLVQEMHEGTLAIRSLLEQILLNERDLLKVSPWDKTREAIAVNATIDALPSAKGKARTDLTVILLKVCGGGRIEIEGINGGTSVEVVMTDTGYTLTLGSATQPLSWKAAQRSLRDRYAQSRAEP